MKYQKEYLILKQMIEKFRTIFSFFRNEYNPCRLVDGFASGYKTMCEQKFIYRQLVAVINQDEIGPQYFRIPSSCCCHVKFVGSFWERISKGHQRHSRDSSGKVEK